MPRPRTELGELLHEYCDHVYFQPPESIRMKFPAIIYALNNIRNRHADNGVYAQASEYTVTVIDKNPDSEIVKAVSLISTARFDRTFITDNLYYSVFTIHF